MEWFEFARETDIPDDEGRAFTVGGRTVAVFRVEGAYFAIDDVCPHSKQAQLSMGFVDGTTVECPLHQSCFDLRTGKVLSPPCAEDVGAYPVKAEGGVLYLNI